MKNTLMVTLLMLTFYYTKAQTATEEYPTRINILFGLNQPLLAEGFNIEGNLFYKRWVFDYSHGVSLDFSGDTVTGELEDQNLAVHIPFTTGFGIGYQFTNWFNIRVEPKWHRFEIYPDGTAQNNSNLIVDYTTFTLGVGAYVNWLPFKNRENFLQGIMVSPSVRFWPRLSSTLDDEKFVYENSFTGNTETHNAMDAGIANSPFIFNISVGYSFDFNSKK
ncbi:hypothetical protein [uncultured Croceitalea sp.]|uniref:hypothetical protein n=1 Tax=uncultured Croceitalea sp. TaxID=1798908 RepID=UPI003305EAD7